MKRSNKFWFANEKKIMEKLGFKPQPGSGSGWLHKEDGENEIAICQLKSTDAKSFKLDTVETNKLIYHANVSNKIPVFIIEFMNNQTWMCIRPEDIKEFVNYIINNKIKEKSDIKIKPKEKSQKKIKYSERVEENAKEESKEKTVNDIWREREKREKQKRKEKEWKDRFKE